MCKVFLTASNTVFGGRVCTAKLLNSSKYLVSEVFGLPASFNSPNVFYNSLAIQASNKEIGADRQPPQGYSLVLDSLYFSKLENCI